MTEIDISHLFGGVPIEPEHTVPLTEHFCLVNGPDNWYFATTEGIVETTMFGKLALYTANESGGFFSGRAYIEMCEQYGIIIKQVYPTDVTVIKTFTLGQ